jgi:hypothetical protein
MPQKETRQVSAFANGMGKIFWAISTLVLGLVVIYFFKSSMTERIGIISKKPFVTGLVGFAVLMLTPLVFFLLLITMIGAPLAMVLLLEYIVSVMIAATMPLIMIGEWVFKTLKKKVAGYYWPLVVGVTLVGVLYMIPVIGGILGFILLCVGLGSIFLSFLPEK